MDQRLIHHYSLAYGLLQVKRWLPTFIMDRLASERITRSGKGDIGAYRASFDFFKDVMYNKRKFRPKDFKEEYNKSPKHRQEAFLRWSRYDDRTLFILCFIASFKPFADGDDDLAAPQYSANCFLDINTLARLAH